jgi:adenosine deaminase
MNENLIRVQEEVLGKAGIVQPAENALESAWLSRATKDRYIAELKAYAGEAIIISSSRIRERHNQAHRSDAVTCAADA